MVNRTDSEPATDRLPTHLLPTERSTGLLDTPAYRPTCPDGHGDLVDDGTAPSCPRCGRTDSTGTTMLANLLNPDLARFNQPLQLDPDTTSATRTREITPVRPHNSAQPDEPAPGHADVATHTEPAPSPTPRPVEDHPTEQFGIVREPLGKLHSATTRDELVDPDERDHPTPDLTTRARGTRRDGTIRTTGWLQIGTHPIAPACGPPSPEPPPDSPPPPAHPGPHSCSPRSPGSPGSPPPAGCAPPHQPETANACPPNNSNPTRPSASTGPSDPSASSTKPPAPASTCTSASSAEPNAPPPPTPPATSSNSTPDPDTGTIKRCRSNPPRPHPTPAAPAATTPTRPDRCR